jgi:hypothetical protein
MFPLMAGRTKRDQFVQVHGRRAGFSSPDDVPASLSTNRNSDTSNHLIRAFDGEVSRSLRCQASAAGASDESSRSSLTVPSRKDRV